MYKGHFPTLGEAVELRPPPFTFTDGAGREIAIRPYGATEGVDEYEALVDMYLDFDPDYRSLGIPPTDERRIRAWLDVILSDHCVLAWHDGRPIGQAVLVHDEGDSYELAIFLHQDYHGVGVGSELLPAMLSYGKAHGVEHVWLLVEWDNRLAVNLYNDVGFAVVDEDGYDVEMALTL